MRGIYALSIALLLTLLFVLTFIVIKRVFERQVATFSDYISAARRTYLLHDVEYSLRQALYFALEDSAASGDPAVVLASAKSWLGRWVSAWAMESVTIDINVDLLSVIFNPGGSVSISYPYDFNVFIGSERYAISGVRVEWSGG